MSLLSDALDSAYTTMTLDSRDWAENKRDAWLYGILVGWGAAAVEFEQKGWWRPEDTSRMRLLHTAIIEARSRGRRRRSSDNDGA
jgi:hypothetical protein